MRVYLPSPCRVCSSLLDVDRFALAAPAGTNPFRVRGAKKSKDFVARARELERLRGPLHRSRSKELDPVKKLTHYSACFDNDWRFRRLAFCTPYSPWNDGGLLFGSDYMHADLAK